MKNREKRGRRGPNPDRRHFFGGPTIEWGAGRPKIEWGSTIEWGA
jgi:hypothetical protein